MSPDAAVPGSPSPPPPPPAGPETVPQPREAVAGVSGSPIPETVLPAVPSPSPAEDLARLERMDWLGATLIRFRSGKHPVPEIEALLGRRLNLSRAPFQGNYVLRLICTLGFVLMACTVAWTIIWSVGSLLGLTPLVREMSGMMVTLLIVLMAISVSQPMNLLDEKALETAGLEELKKLRAQVARDKLGKPGSEP